jgi:glycosyltransferase involved in cell wall biosynthesis
VIVKEQAPVSIVVLTFNSENILEKTLTSAFMLSDDVHVLDSYSEDYTVRLAEGMGARVQQRRFKNYSDQRNWAMDNLVLKYEWELHLDADERVDDVLHAEIVRVTTAASASADAYLVARQVIFLRRAIMHGGMFPLYHLRLFRRHAARVEEREYDQHFVTSGRVETLSGAMIDEISMGLTEWINRHNRWADAEVRELTRSGTISKDRGLLARPILARRRRRELYYRFPALLRPFLFFLHRYFVKQGFRDGREGLIFHVLQGFWFRFLIDAKLFEEFQNRR